MKLLSIRLRTGLKNLNRYRQWIGLRNALAFVLRELAGSRVLRSVELGGETVYVRTGTPDLLVAARCLVLKEYAHIQCPNPLVVVDAGANIGTSAVFFAKTYPNAAVYAIEPESGNYEILLKNTRSYSRIVPIRAALAADTRVRVLKDRGTGPWGYTVVATDCETQPMGQQVECTTVSEILRQYDLSSIDILKMDIEGAEREVFESADDWIGRVGIITAELHDRICMGCARAFYLATKDFVRFERHHELVTAYQKWPPTINER